MDTRIALGDLVFDVRVEGPEDGPPTVLLHGFPQTSRSWAGVIDALSGHGLRLVAPDQRGYSPGARPAATSAYAVDLLAADVLGLMRSLGHDRFHLVGHDWGASVAWWLAAHHPDAIASLVAVSVPHLAAYGWALREDADQQRRAEYIGLFRREGRAEEVLLADDARRLRAMYGDAVSAAHVDADVAMMSGGALTPALGWYRAMRGDLLDLPVVSVPTTYVWSDADSALGRAGAERCGEFVTGDYRYLVLPGVSHWIPDEAPRELAAAILARVRD